VEQIWIDARDLGTAQRWLNSVVPGVRKAVRDTIIDTLDFGQSEIKRQITARYDITSEDLTSGRRGLVMRSVKPPPLSEGNSEIAGYIEMNSKRLPTMRFNVIPTEVPPQKDIPVSQRQVVSRIVVRGSANVGSPNRFIAKMSSGHIGVFLRKPDSTHRIRPDGQRTQLNISEEYMISPYEMIRSREIQPKLSRAIGNYFRGRLQINLAKARVRRA
jgi:hypothetical protein